MVRYAPLSIRQCPLTPCPCFAEHFESLEYEGPVLQPGDIAIWIRHDDVVEWQQRVFDACAPDGIETATCKKENNPCALAKYQSIAPDSHDGWLAGGGATWEDKLANGHDADYNDCIAAGTSAAECEALWRNDRHAVPNQYVDYFGDVKTPVPTDHKAVSTRLSNPITLSLQTQTQSMESSNRDLVLQFWFQPAETVLSTSRCHHMQHQAKDLSNSKAGRRCRQACL